MDKQDDMKDMKKEELYQEKSSVNDHVKNPYMTRRTGAPVVNDTDPITAGPRGPIMLQDTWLLEKLAHFDRENIPERRMHAKGWGAFGKFVCTEDITDLTYAAPFSEVGKETELFARFSTVAGESGAADAERDIRGFALKFYTEDGNWDLAGNNTPVFFLRNPHRFTDLNRAVKRDPHTHLRSANNQWDFWTGMPEALFQVTITMSDRGIPNGFRHMHGFSSHAYSMINKEGVRHWVKYHFLTQQGIEYLTNEEANKINATDRESFGRDLHGAIERGDFPRWTAYIQVMTEEEAEKMETNPFDLTKVWLKKDFPLKKIGYFELNKNPDNYFAQVEQAAFDPANIIPGLGFSPDRVLQARLFSYGDAQRYRLGVNHNLIPVNYPKNAKNFHSYHKDGAMRVDDNNGAELIYSPNSYGGWVDHQQHGEPDLKLDGAMNTYSYREDDNDYYTQPGMYFRLMTDDQKQRLFDNTAGDMEGVEEHIKLRHIAHCYFADKDYGKGVAEALGITDKVDWDMLDEKLEKEIKGAYGDSHELQYDKVKSGEKDRIMSNDPDQVRNTEGPKQAESQDGEGEAKDFVPTEEDQVDTL